MTVNKTLRVLTHATSLGALCVSAVLAPLCATATELLIDTGQPVGTASLSIIDTTRTGAGNEIWRAAKFTLTTEVVIDSVAGWMQVDPINGICSARMWIDVTQSSDPLPSAAPGQNFGDIFPACGGPAWVTSSGLNKHLFPGTYWITFQPVVDFVGFMQTGAPNPLASYADAVFGTWAATSPNPGLGVRITGTVGPPPPVPPNDDRSQALDILPGSYTGVLAGATPDGTSSCRGNGQPDIWYRVTAPITGALRVSTCGTHDLGGVDLGTDTIVSLHSPDGLTELGCNDDWPVATAPVCPAASGALRDSFVQKPVVQGQQVLVRVTKYLVSPVNDVLLNVSFEPDSDGDGVNDVSDNCTAVANNGNPGTGAAQLDADGDGYGNICDADLNNSGLVTTADFGILRSVLNQAAGSSATAAAADLNGSGTVTTADFAILRARLNTAPGPSGLHP